MSGHHHHHGHRHGQNQRILTYSLLITATYMLVEIIGGLWANSLALLSDAGHMFSDLLALGLSLLAFHWSARAANGDKSYGYGRGEILAAAFNGLTLLAIALLVAVEGLRRLLKPAVVQSQTMLLIAVIGLLVNLAVAGLMWAGDRENLNMRSALLHVLGDLLGSLGAVAAGLLMWFYGYYWADPLISLLVAGLLAWGGWQLSRDSLHILMEGQPAHISLAEIRRAARTIAGIRDIHHLHCWSLSSDYHLFSCHLLLEPQLSLEEGQQRLRQLEEMVLRQGISHCTIQMERSCDRADCHCQLNAES